MLIRSDGVRAAAASPGSVAGLKLQLRADLGITLNGADVSAWADQSGNGNDAAQTTAANQPAFVASDAFFANEPSVNFDGVDAVPEYLSWASFPSPGSACDAFFALRLAADPSAGTSAGAWNFGTAGGSQDHVPFSDGVVYSGFGSTVRKTTGNPTFPLTTPHIMEIISAAGEWTMNIAHAQHYTTGTNTFGWRGSGWQIGLSLLGAAWKARVAEMLVYDHKLSVSDRALVSWYFANRYGI